MNNKMLCTPDNDKQKQTYSVDLKVWSLQVLTNKSRFNVSTQII